MDKIVEFENYCPTCFYRDEPESNIICDECLTNTTNVDTHRPFCYKERHDSRIKAKLDIYNLYGSSEKTKEEEN